MNEFICMRRRSLRILDRCCLRSRQDGHRIPWRQVCSFAGLTVGAWFGEGTVLKKRSPALRRGGAARDPPRDDGPRHLPPAVREQRRLQPLPGGARPVIALLRIRPLAGCDGVARPLYRDPTPHLGGPPGGNRRRDLQANAKNWKRKGCCASNMAA